MRINIGQEFVIGGFTPGSNGIDALIVGYYEGRKLIYAARVRAGLVPASRRELYEKLKPHILQTCPFVNLPEATPGRWGQGLTSENAGVPLGETQACGELRVLAVDRLESCSPHRVLGPALRQGSSLRGSETLENVPDPQCREVLGIAC
jgi:ATP dependent DNA ligase C terminal region